VYAYAVGIRVTRAVDGFYEWRKVLGGKIPYNIQMKDGRPFVFAGLWEGWKNLDLTASGFNTRTGSTLKQLF
jgi:putative SOS response-associated peptidase YedK